MLTYDELLKTGKYEEAKKVLASALNSNNVPKDKRGILIYHLAVANLYLLDNQCLTLFRECYNYGINDLLKDVFYINYANAELKMGDKFKAASLAKQAAFYNSKYNVTAAQILFFVGNYDEAIVYYRKMEESPDTNIALANCYKHKNKLEMAAKLFKENIRKAKSAFNINIFATFYEYIGKFSQAQALYKLAAKKGDETVKNLSLYNLSLIQMYNNNYIEGSINYENRFKLNPPVASYYKQIKIWDFKQPGTILVRCEQGFGDCIQFLRYIDQISKTNNVIIETYHPLATLIGKKWPNIKIILPGTPFSITDVDYQISLMSLALYYKSNNIEVNDTYLSDLVTVNTECTNKVGILWYGSSAHKKDGLRSIPLDYFMSKLPVDNKCTLHHLSNKNLIDNSYNIIDESTNINDFYDLLVVLSSMDYVICVDTALAHLAGSIGKKCYLLLPYVPDWRWGCSWYKSVTMIKQDMLFNWDSVFIKLGNLLNGKQGSN